jgi:hypothetical protein
MPSCWSDTAQQRLWLGSNRYRSGCRNPGTNTKCLAYSCVKRYPLRGYESDSDANCNSNGYRYANCDDNCYSHSNAYCYRGTEIYSNTETSSHTPAKTIVVFASGNYRN